MGNAAVKAGKRATYPAYKPSGAPWLGNVPEHWEVCRLKYSADLINQKVDGAEADLPYMGLEHIESWTGKRLGQNGNASSDGQANLFRRGDVLFGKLRPYLAKAYAADSEGICTGELLVLRPKAVEQKFLLDYVLNPDFVTIVDSSTYGAKMPRANWDFIGNLPALIPPLDEQKAIAAFLDRETARIDALIEKKQRQIELLQEKRSALISHAVTKGLDPNAPMKDSGIDGLEGIPAHWGLMRLKFLTPQVTVGIVITPSKYYEDSGVPCLRSLNVRPDHLTENDLVFISPVSNELLGKSKLRAGDLVVVRTGKPGTAAVVDERFDGANCIDLIIVRKSGRFDSRFMCYVLNSELSLVQYVAGTSGAIQGHFNIETASNMLIPVPPLDEQMRIRERLDLEVGKLKRLGEKIEESIKRLRDHRSALISAAVTGKIDVRVEVTSG